MVDAFPTLREYVASLVHQQGKPQKAVAADMDLSPSMLTRKCAQSPDDSARLTVDNLEEFIKSQDDSRPVLYLVEKYLAGNNGRIEALERELARLKGRA